jgi:hypothetical protein
METKKEKLAASAMNLSKWENKKLDSAFVVEV